MDSVTKKSSGLIEKSKIEDVITKMPLSSKMLRFMKPTICSTWKPGTGYQNLHKKENSHKKDIRHERRKKQLSLSQAESVSFPIKGMAESYSGSSMSRASRLVDLNETKYNHETSQCSFRTNIKTLSRIHMISVLFQSRLL